ncbi:MAG: PAS domain S-box protein [Bacteroidetes bacterium]|nr:PAS domain S-box protein [Bacteroidota bacterium]
MKKYAEKIPVSDKQKMVIAFQHNKETMANEKLSTVVSANILQGQQFHRYSHQIINILNSITDGFFMLDGKFNVTLWNPEAEKIFGVNKQTIVGKNIFETIPGLKELDIYDEFIDAFSRKKIFISEKYISGKNMWLEINSYPSDDGLFVYFRDISKRKIQEMLLELEKKVLEINSDQKASLKITIDYFLEGVENIFPGMFCSVLTVDDDKVTLRHLAAPSLPVEYSSAIDGTKIGPSVGSCGTAVYRKKRVIVSNIAKDPLWKNYKKLAQQFNLYACWSLPIIDAQREVLATFAIYYDNPKSPSDIELNLLERAVELIKIIIENKRAEEKIKLINERYVLATKATNDAIWDWDVKSDISIWTEGFYKMFGIKPSKRDKENNLWEPRVHEDDKERVLKGLKKFIEKKEKGVWRDEYRFKKANGKFALIADRGFLIFDTEGNAVRMVGSMQDITEKRDMEKKLLMQELNRQKQIMQAVVEAQEKERAEIGKELHDNVNQILSTTKLNLESVKNRNEDWENVISRSVKNISHAINELRNISRSLVPSSIGDLGLIDSINDLIENIKALNVVHVEFYPIGQIEDKVNAQQKLMLFRIVQEQVNNVLKHSQADNLIIELILIDNRIELNISDDGKGFDPAKVKHKKGLGLSNIINRVGLFDGKVSIVSAKGQGCKLSVQVPIHNL